MSQNNEVCEKVKSEYCPIVEGGQKVTIMKNGQGEIGGYFVTLPIVDSQISYLVANGDFLISFHIFDTDENKQKVSKVIDELRQRYPIEEPLVC